MRRILYWLLRVLFRFRAYNAEVLNTPGPVLLVPNHVSWIDWMFFYALAPTDWKCVVSSVAANYSWIHRKLMIHSRSFPIDNTSPYALKHMAEYLESGGRLMLYAEGQLTRTGSLMKVYEGTGFLLHKTGAKVINCYVRGANRMRLSRQPGWRKWFPQVTLHFSPPVTPPAMPNMKTSLARERLTTWLQRRMMEQQFRTEQNMGPSNVLDAIVETARHQPRKVILQDSTMRELRYRHVLVGADLMARKLGAALSRNEERVGVLLPNVNATPVVLLALWALDKTPSILNFSTGPRVMLNCCRIASLKRIITSRVFVEKAKLDLAPLTEAGLKFIYLEDVREEISSVERLGTLIRHMINPNALKHDRGSRRSPMADEDRTAVVLFTSGSEGLPKGVELTHGNLLANIRQMEAVIAIEDSDRIFNALPIFHSFGLTVGTMLGLTRGIYVFLYPSPLHFRVIPSVVYDRHCTLMLSTNTFLRRYARTAHAYDFRAVRWLFAGAEKLQPDTSRLWAEKFGIRVFEGYGVTESSPVVSVNTPMAPRVGTAGQFVPGVEWKIERVDGVPDGGRLLIKGPNIMRGYLNPEANAKFKALDGWYDTGDIAKVDDDGFLRILGRLKRFAKISGEMISLTSVEEALSGAFPELGDKLETAVISRPDADKGEAIVAVTNDPRLTVEQARKAVRAKGLSNLCAPQEIIVVKEIPKLGTGKVSHRELAELVQERGSD